MNAPTVPVAAPGVRSSSRTLRALLVLLAAAVLAAVVLLLGAAAGSAGELDPTLPDPTLLDPTLPGPVAPVDPTAPTDPTPPGSDEGLSVGINGINGEPSSAVLTLIGITLLSVAPALLLMMTSFTKIFVVLAMTRNALSLPSIPPNQVLAGLALFLSLFIMAPVLTQINDLAVQPYISGATTFTQALSDGAGPLQTFMLAHTREEDLALMTRAADLPNPEDAASVPLTTLIPAFMISELRAAFIIGFVIFVPFLVIDLVVSAALMSMGMMMLPPVMISLPFKILLFVLVDGWGLIITALVNSYTGAGG